MKNVLVTGASGLIGRKVCSGLLKKGYGVIATDKSPHEYNEGKERYHFISAEITDEESIQKLFRDYKIDAVVHCACTADNDFGHIITENEIKISSAVDGFLYAMASAEGVGHFILISTTQVYELPKTREPIRETDKVKITTNYAKLKYDSETVLSNQVLLNQDMITAAIRVAPVYTSDFYDNLMSKVIDADGVPFMYRTGDYGFQFCCLHNLVDFILCYLRVAETNRYTGIYNMADRYISTAAEIVKFIRQRYRLGPVIQKNIGVDGMKSVLGIIKNREESKTNYRYNDFGSFFNNNVIDATKASKICSERWNLQNTK
ncbi:MAG: NAD(P)-dependent oxidoreductase [Oscillospiraceae bacterium]|nr:NAD(P)-dependent oxidoreductase [Oscillospiraceae bacterium]